MTTTASDKPKEAEPPLWSIGIAAAIILVTPLILYSLAPTGPIREGDTVFSDGEQRVHARQMATDKEAKDDTCLLDPNNPLIVLQPPSDQTDELITARVQGNSAGERPFCPVHAEVILKTQQVFQKPAVFVTAREILVGLVGR